MNITNKIKEIISNFTKKEYYKYLNNNSIIFIESKDLYTIIKCIYSDNIKILKTLIRDELKNELKDDYSSISIENCIFDIFQDSEFNINYLFEKIKVFQNENYLKFNKQIIDNSLGIKIKIEDNKCIIIGLNNNQNNNEEIILNYNYLYSINGIILNKIDNIQTNIANIIKENIKDKTFIDIELYSLK